jgi:hypothetical protein
MSFPRTTPFPAESGSPSSSPLACGIGVRLIIASVACGLLWWVVFWALA